MTEHQSHGADRGQMLGETTFELTVDDLAAAYRLNFRRSLRRQLPLLLGLGGLLTGSALAWSSPRPGLGVRSFEFVGGVLLWTAIASLACAAQYMGLSRRARKTANQQKSVQGRISLGWSDRKLCFSTGVSTAQLSWDAVIAAAECSHILLLYQSDALFHAIPKRALSSEQISSIRNLLPSR